MNCKLLLSAAFISASLMATAQDGAKSYAITGKANNTFFWADIKQIDLATGKVVKTLFEAEKTTFKTTTLDNSGEAYRQPNQNPTAFGVAACAMDVRHNRLYFAPMHFSDISYLDLGKTEATFTTVKRNVISKPFQAGYQPEETQITRMVIAADGNGYALTNDAQHLIRFTTGKRVVVEDLGGILDAAENKGISIHNKCTSWGGDMVADAFGKLVVISANHNVFSIDVTTRVATHLGYINGLPAHYSTNGAAVNEDGDMVVSSANVFEALYKINMKSLTATRIESTDAPFNASDLANGNLLNQKEAAAITRFDLTKPAPFAAAAEGKVFPNPIIGNEFRIAFDGQKAGVYTVVLADLAGRVLQSNVINNTSSAQVHTIRLSKKQTPGMYLVKVLDAARQQVLSEKIVIE